MVGQRVSVVAVFKDKGGALDLCLPVKMRHKGQEFVLTELGLRHPTVAGKRMIHVFDMSDGVNDYRLEFDAEALSWTLVSQIEGHHAST